jgi:hypothetical protein
MVKAAFSTPFVEVRLNASSTTLPGIGRGGHCADAATKENPHTANESEYLNPARISKPSISQKIVFPKDSLSQMLVISR